MEADNGCQRLAFLPSRPEQVLVQTCWKGRWREEKGRKRGREEGRKDLEVERKKGLHRGREGIRAERNGEGKRQEGREETKK